MPLVEKDTTKIYDVVLVVELQEGGNGKNVPFISYRYPSLFTQDPFTSSVTQFCFPDINQFPTESMPTEIFSFVLTEGDGERRFGYCLRRLPSGTGPRYPIAYSIMSFFPCYSLFKTILENMANNYENQSMKSLTEFVDSVLQHPFPAPGKTFEVNMQGSSTRFTRPNDSDSQLEHVELDSFLTILNDENIVIIFVSLLIERRIIFCASKLSVLSSCIQAAIALLYPFSWQHIYIPVLPKSLLNFVCAPMPFVVGILKTELAEVESMPMDEVLIIDLDADDFIRIPGATPTEDLNRLPATYIELLRKALRTASKNISKLTAKRKKEKKDELALQQIDYELKRQKQDLTDTFVNFFVHTLGSYRRFISNGKFDKESFMQNQSGEIAEFMELLTASQMFERFVEERLCGLSAGGFEKRIDHYDQLSKYGFNEEQVEGVIPIFNPDKGKRPSAKKKPNLKVQWNTLRSQFKKDQAAPVAMDDIVLGAPTLVSHTGSSSQAAVGSPVRPGGGAPPPPPKAPTSPPAFVVPKKAIPPPPAGHRSISESTLPEFRPSNTGSTKAQGSPVPTPPARYAPPTEYNGASSTPRPSAPTPAPRKSTPTNPLASSVPPPTQTTNLPPPPVTSSLIQRGQRRAQPHRPAPVRGQNHGNSQTANPPPPMAHANSFSGTPITNPHPNSNANPPTGRGRGRGSGTGADANRGQSLGPRARPTSVSPTQYMNSKTSSRPGMAYEFHSIDDSHRSVARPPPPRSYEEPVVNSVRQMPKRPVGRELPPIPNQEPYPVSPRSHPS